MERISQTTQQVNLARAAGGADGVDGLLMAFLELALEQALELVELLRRRIHQLVLHAPRANKQTDSEQGFLFSFLIFISFCRWQVVQESDAVLTSKPQLVTHPGKAMAHRIRPNSFFLLVVFLLLLLLLLLLLPLLLLFFFLSPLLPPSS